MSRRATPHPHQIEQTAREVLAGRATMSTGDLLDAIHAINPTGRSLAPTDERRRYELKARLQSLLIRRTLDDLEVTIDAHGIVAIRHRFLPADACHARLDELDEDARAGVQLRLDLGEPDGQTSATPAVAGRSGDAPQSAVDAGRAALADYDYDAARAHFETAALEAGDPDAARELLALLVDHLALYEDARALESRLPARCAKDGEVRALLAISAARLGAPAEASRLLAGLQGARAAEAWSVLGEEAATRGSADEVEHCVTRLAACDPTHPAIVRLRAEVTRLQAEASRPAEQALLALAEAGDDGATLAQARALLARWPGNAVAGKLIHRIEERRRTDEAARLVERAHAALGQGQVERASELCAQARALGADVTRLAEQIRAATEARRKALEDAAVDGACTQLAATDLRPGLAAYLELAPELRRRVRDRAQMRMLAWLEQAAPRGKEHRHAAVIDGVLAIGAAEAASARGDHEGVIALLDRHAEILAAVSEARELRAGASAGIAARRRDAASDALGRARGALAAGHLALAEQALAEADARTLDAAGRAALDELRHALRARRDRAQRRAQIDQLVASGDLVAARRALDELRRAHGSEDPSEQRELDELRAAVRRSWRIRSHAPAGPAQDARRSLGELFSTLPFDEHAAPWLCAAGRELLAVRGYGDHLFVVRVSVDGARVLARHSLTPPAPLGELIEIAVDGDSLWLVGETGQVLQLAWETCEPVRWAPLAPHLASGERIEHAFLVPPAAHLWLEAAVPGGGAETLRVLELATWRIRRELPRARLLHPVIAGTRSCMLGMGLDSGSVRYSERGAVQDELTACANIVTTAAAVDPEGDLIVLGSRPGAEQRDDPTLEIRCIEHGRTTQRVAVPESSFESTHRCASVRDPAGLVLHYHRIEGGARLAWFQRTRAALAPIYDVPAPTDLVIAQDTDATQAVALWDSDHGIDVLRLGPEVPAFVELDDQNRPWFLPTLDGYFSCGHHAPDDDARLLSTAEAAVKDRDWSRVRSLLEPVALDSVPPDQRAHHCHLLGLALLRTGGDPEAVRGVWEAGHRDELAHERLLPCRLDACLDLLGPAPDPVPDAWTSTDSSLTRRLRGAIAETDRLLAAGQVPDALRAIRRRVVHRAREQQSAARLAAVWLATDLGSDPACPDAFDKAVALSRFLALRQLGCASLPIPEAWDDARLADVAAEAACWLAAWDRA